jgi:hypothetical protein
MSRPSPEEIADERYQEERRDRYICAALTGIMAATNIHGTKDMLVTMAVEVGEAALEAADKAAS